MALIGFDVGLSLLRQRWQGAERYLEGLPVVLVENRQVVEGHLSRSRVDIEEILEAGRTLQGLERLDQVKDAVLEQSGGISIVLK